MTKDGRGRTAEEVASGWPYNRTATSVITPAFRAF